MTIQNLTIRRFEASDITGEEFTHEAHVYVAWLHLQAYGEADGSARFDAGLRRLVAALGAEDKYNEMVTWLFLKLIAARMTEGESWESFRQRNRDIIEDRPRGTAGAE